MADIKSMFHQVRVSKSDIGFLRFLWRTDGNIDKDPKDHRMLVHLFGAALSPSCASFALQRTAEDNLHMKPQVTNTIMHHFYVDDCLTSLPTVQDAVQLTSDLVELCSKGGFQLTKWVRNNRVVLSNIKEEERGKDIRSLDLDKDQLPVDRALGLQWSVENDDFRFNIVVPEKPHTRRGILSMVSSVYCWVSWHLSLSQPSNCYNSFVNRAMDGMSQFPRVNLSSGLTGSKIFQNWSALMSHAVSNLLTLELQ